MHTLVIASQKGGTGKTTLAGHLAVAAELRWPGEVAIADLDPQRSLYRWWQARAAETPVLVELSPATIEARQAELARAGCRLLVIDTPPAAGRQVEAVLAHAGLVLVPVQPSPHDLHAMGATIELARRAGRPWRLVLTQVAPRSGLTQEALAALAAEQEAPPLPTIGRRVLFAGAMIDGRTAGEIDPRSTAAQEVAALLDGVLSCFLASTTARKRSART
jgi:chromosome partitioning protein